MRSSGPSSSAATSDERTTVDMRPIKWRDSRDDACQTMTEEFVFAPSTVGGKGANGNGSLWTEQHRCGKVDEA